MNAINRFRRSIHKVIGKEQRPNSNIPNGPNPFVYTYVCVCDVCIWATGKNIHYQFISTSFVAPVCAPHLIRAERIFILELFFNVCNVCALPPPFRPLRHLFKSIYSLRRRVCSNYSRSMHKHTQWREDQWPYIFCIPCTVLFGGSVLDRSRFCVRHPRQAVTLNRNWYL